MATRAENDAARQEREQELDRQARRDAARRNASKPSAAGSGRRLKRVKDSFFVEDLGKGNKRFVWVLWKDQGVAHGAPAED